MSDSRTSDAKLCPVCKSRLGTASSTPRQPRCANCGWLGSIQQDTASTSPESPDRALEEVTRPYTADNGHSKGVAADSTGQASGTKRQQTSNEQFTAIKQAVDAACTALPVLFTMCSMVGLRAGAMATDEILGSLKLAQKELAHLQHPTHETTAGYKPTVESAAHESTPPGCRCSDCSIDGEACPSCYAIWWRKRHPNVTFQGGPALKPDSLGEQCRQYWGRVERRCQLTQGHEGECYFCVPSHAIRTDISLDGPASETGEQLLESGLGERSAATRAGHDKSGVMTAPSKSPCAAVDKGTPQTPRPELKAAAPPPTPWPGSNPNKRGDLDEPLRLSEKAKCTHSSPTCDCDREEP